MRLFHDLIDRSPAPDPNQPALRYRGADLSYGRLRELSRRTAAGLEALGLKRGERLAIFLGNRPEAIELALACSRIGAIFIPLSPMLRARQLAHVLADSGAKVLVTSESLLHLALQSAADAVHLRAIVLVDAVELPKPIRPELPFVLVDDLRSYDPLTHLAGVIDNDAAAILYTSGSTGRSKGVVTSHRNLVSGASIVAQYLGNVAEDRLLAALPLSFDYGLSQVTTAFHVGACAVLTGFSLPAATIQEIAAERITGLAGVPTMWAHLAAAEWPAGSCEHLRYITNSGGALTPALVRTLRSRLRTTRLYCMYGLTEAFRSTYLEPEELERRTGSIGRAIPNQEVFVVRADGSRCAPDEVGELVHRGSLVTLGYWNDPRTTEERFRPVPAWITNAAPWERAVWSGDLARADAEGFLYFVSRADQLIKTSGYRVSPTEIEEVIAEVPGVIDSVAVGLPDAVLGQKIALALVASPARAQEVADAVRRHCRMHLPAYMSPGEIHVVENLPRNTNNKADRPAIASMLMEQARLGVSVSAAS